MRRNFFKPEPSGQKIKDTKRNCIKDLKSKADDFIKKNINFYLEKAREKGLQMHQEKEFIEKLKSKIESSVQKEYLNLATEVDRCNNL